MYQVGEASVKLIGDISLLKPTSWVGDAPPGLTFINYACCPHCIDVFGIYLRINSNLCYSYYKLIGFYNREEKCSHRGTKWVFK
jgi:hypothetical protein